MDQQRRALIQEVFEHVVDKTPSHRADYLDMVCEGDEPLREEVEALLTEHEQVGAETIVATESFEARIANVRRPAVPTQVGDYKILEQLGAGGMGVVYRAEHLVHGVVALKLLPKYTVSDPTAAQRFRMEADALSCMQHPALCQIYECFVDDAYAVLALELIEGQELADHISECPLTLDFSLDILQTLGEALALAHAQGIVHRDLKPGNVLLTKTGEIKLIDFGIAKFADQKLTATGQVLGTPSYMAPEQWLGKAMDLRTDIWALGGLWYEMLTGQRAFQGQDFKEIADAVLTAPMPRLPWKSIDGVLLKVVQPLMDKLLQREMSERLDSCEELLAEIAQLRQILRN